MNERMAQHGCSLRRHGRSFLQHGRSLGHHVKQNFQTETKTIAHPSSQQNPHPQPPYQALAWSYRY